MRKPYLDNIRWITILLVVVYHVFYIYNASGVAGGIGSFAETQGQDAVMYLVYPWFMLALFVVSGMSARFSLQSRSHKAFLKSRTQKLLLPSTVGVLLFGWALGYFNLRIGGGWEAMQAVPKPVLYLILCVSGTGPLWFLQLLWIYAVLLVLFRKVEKDRLWRHCTTAGPVAFVFMGVLLYAGSFIGNMPVVTVYRCGFYGVGFFLGYLVFSHEETIDRLQRWWRILGAAALILGAAFTAIFWKKPFTDHAVLDSPLGVAYAWVATLAVLAFAKQVLNFETPVTHFLRKQTWGLYLFHYLPLAACAYFISPTSLPVLVKYLVTAIAAFGGAEILYSVFSRIPGVRVCLCGISGK